MCFPLLCFKTEDGKRSGGEGNKGELDNAWVPCLWFPDPRQVFKGNNEGLRAIVNISRSLTESAFTQDPNAEAKPEPSACFGLDQFPSSEVTQLFVYTDWWN